ncbi:fatty acid synthase-like isoform X2 [Macrosteles quadrilineatus]|uniref:fatty acid synthase-like isoform X2 n=1 Tax=Macrosteles quadrilineatus TaxID=74068 RepID=UPI0023E30C16|nr:fatty acid synthase-like isoform X2 [Macrosteles quadrilineatus]
MGIYPYEVVISGISGKFPNCHNVQEFKEKLFSKEFLLTPDDKRWNPAERDKPFLTGKVPDVEKFDIAFFGVPKKLGLSSDPVLGLSMEASTEAMIDAGVNPCAMKGRNISVIVASTTTDAEVLRYFDGSFLDGQAMQGLARTMFANRLSYVYNFTGPSYNVDSTWVSAVQGLEKAAAIVGQGHVEAAIVTCVNLTFHNSIDREFMDIDPELLSESERCSPFDAKADGFLRSEGIVSFFIQRTQDAKRNYCTVLNTQTRCLNGHPSSYTSINPSLEHFFNDFYTKSEINPKDVSYVETFGFCNKDRDADELNAVEKVFCEKRNSSLLIGCGTGNYGNTETSSSFVSLTKAIFALEEGLIPPTLNYNTPNPVVPGLVNGKLKPVTESTKLTGDLVAVNTLNYSGNAAHTLLRRNGKAKKSHFAKNLSKDDLPRLCILQARNEEGASFVAKKISNTPYDAEFVSLVNNVFKTHIPHYLWRGFSVVPGADGQPPSEIKIGLVNILRALGVSPDGMIGHSAGETCCAYADDCLTLEEAIMASYYRGKATLDVQSTQVKGMMAAIGIGYEDIKDRVPPTIDVACHNSSDSCTISGPEDDIMKYVEELKCQGVFAKAVDVSGIAYHSRYIRPIAPRLFDYLTKAIKSPKPRSSKWICTSASESLWDHEDVKLCSAKYFTNNLINPVYFEEGCKFIPKNAVIIEIAPHGLLQAILRRSISPDCINIPLTSRTAGSNLYYFLSAVGKLYLNSVDIDANAIFPAVEYPVSRGTPILSTLVTWDHEESRKLDFHAEIQRAVQTNTFEMSISLSSETAEFKYWREHCLDGNVVLPLMQLLVHPWTMVYSKKQIKMENHSVVFEDVIFSNIVTVGDVEKHLSVNFSPTSYRFEISNDELSPAIERNIVTGKVREANVQKHLVPRLDEEGSSLTKVNGKEVYDALAQYGIQLGPQFQVIKQITIGEYESAAKIKWTCDVIVFVDALLKFLTYVQIEKKPSSMHQPTSFIKLEINKPLLCDLPNNTVLDVHYDSRCNRLVCVAIELLGVTFKSTPYKRNDCLKWRELKFKPYFDSSISLDEFLRTSQQIAKEVGLGTWLVNPAPLHLLLVKPETPENQSSYQNLVKLFHGHTYLYDNVSEVDVDEAIHLLKSNDQQRYLVVGDQTTVFSLTDTINPDKLYCITFVKSLQTNGVNLRSLLACDHEGGKLTLMKKTNNESPVVVSLEGKDWLEKTRKAVEALSNPQSIVLVTRSLEPRQVLPILANEPYVASIRTVFIQQANAAQYSNTSPTFSSQLLLGLPVNILFDGIWGSLRSEEVKVDMKSNLNASVERTDAGIDLHYIGLNPPTFDDGLECDLPELKCADYSGTTEADQPVMGVAMFQTDSKSLSPDPVLRWPVPSDFTMEDAATVPVTYGLAYYCINLKAKVEPGETVLVHAGMSPIGQAVICMALTAGADVITFVSNKEEGFQLRKRFPKLNPSYIIIRGLEDLDIPVRKLTQGRGAEVIVNCLRGRDMQATVKVMGTDCRFLHLGRITVEDRESIGMLVFLKRTSLHGITVENLTRCSEEEKIQIQRAVLDGIIKGDVKPLKRKTFPWRSQSEVLEFLKNKSMEEKTVISIKGESTSSKSFTFDPHEFVVIAGTSSNFWLDVASWVLAHGGQHLIVLTTENMMAAKNFHKIDRLVSQHPATLTLYPLSRFDTIQNGTNLIEELLQLRPIDTFLCLNMDECSSRMRNLEIAVRKTVPRLRRFLALLGQGAGVCEARARGGLNVCCIQRDTHLDSPANILPYLKTILADKTSGSKFMAVGDFTRRSNKEDLRISSSDVQEHLPQSLAELELLGLNLSQTQLQEVPSLSPRYEYVRHQLLPVFVIPGISSSRIEPLIQRLMHPVFCPTLPPSLTTFEQSATYLLEQIQAIQKNGPYNLIGETWSGIVTLHLTRLLEERGHKVVVFLLDAAPSLSQARASVFRKSSGMFASEEFLSCILGQQRNMENGVDKLTSWEEELNLKTKCLLSTQQTSEESLDNIRKYLSALKRRLTDIMEYKSQQQKVKATVHLIQTSQYADSELLDMSKCCQNSPCLHKVEDNTLREAIRNPITATIINENAIFTWK